MSFLEEIKNAVIEGNSMKVKEMCLKAIEEGCSASQIIEGGLIGGMNVIGPLFKNNEIFVPEVLVAARAMHSGLDVVKSLLVSSDIQEKGTICYWNSKR